MISLYGVSFEEKVFTVASVLPAEDEIKALLGACWVIAGVNGRKTDELKSLFHWEK